MMMHAHHRMPRRYRHDTLLFHREVYLLSILRWLRINTLELTITITILTNLQAVAMSRIVGPPYECRPYVQ